MASCIDCHSPTIRRDATRCLACYGRHRKLTVHGYIIGVFCKLCQKELTVKNSSTKTCVDCLRKHHLYQAWNKGKKGLVPWNKGKSQFVNFEERQAHKNQLALERWRRLPPQQKVAWNLRTLIRNYFKYKAKIIRPCRAMDLLGCDANYFSSYLESMFTDGMCWDNYGTGQQKWNIDHIIPISSFDLQDIEQAKKAFHFTNCQPMWSSENARKGNRGSAAGISVAVMRMR